MLLLYRQRFLYTSA